MMLIWIVFSVLPQYYDAGRHQSFFRLRGCELVQESRRSWNIQSRRLSLAQKCRFRRCERSSIAAFRVSAGIFSVLKFVLRFRQRCRWCKDTSRASRVGNVRVPLFPLFPAFRTLFLYFIGRSALMLSFKHVSQLRKTSSVNQSATRTRR